MAGTPTRSEADLAARLGGGPRELRAKAAVALGQTGTAAARTLLEAAIADADPVVARRALLALGWVGDADTPRLQC